MLRCSARALHQSLGQNANELFRLCNAPEGVAGGDPVLREEYKERWKVHRDGDWHRSVHLWLIGNGGPGAGGGAEVLLQKRSEHKDTNPGKLDVSCAGHVEGDDSIEHTVQKELHEELGLADLSQFGTLHRAFTTTTPFSSGLPVNDNEWQHVFVACRHPWLGPMAAADFATSPSEVAGLSIVSASELERAWTAGDPRFVKRRESYIRSLLACFERVLLA
ncbi:Nudix hydrolase 3 [Diplonema papillatum]|nr:Nudix hydrolase 3 [Diplonema papillatum]